MRRAFTVVIVFLALQVAAWADGIDLVNKFGSINISTSGIVSKGSQLQQFNAINTGHSLGSLTFSTGALTSGSLQTGGVFSSIGSSFLVTGMGGGGQPKGTIFSGAFVGPVTWTLVSQHGQGLVFQLSGQIAGQLFNGHFVTGTTVQTFHTSVAQLAQGIVHLNSGTTHLAATPEPGTLALLATGLLGIGQVARRKLRARSSP